ncbi:glycosyltransferase family 87 protein [Flavobacterium sp.]|uniref:glycosyltransferase family 87 protein n=1 Tax=Flavobacterium sp. TaxID=239 RepID=UPI003752DC61
MSTFFKHSFFTNKKYIITIWLVITIISAVKQFLIGNYNNYKIFKGVYFHTINKLPLYTEYPSEYFDHNHYGPVFSLIIAPFAVLPDYIGMVLWGVFNAVILVWAITQLPLKQIQITAILWICLHEFLTALLGLQFNPLMTAIIILSFVYIDKEKVFWAAMFIVLGIFVKLYGVVGLAFFFFTKDKIKFIASLVFWSIVLFVLPMLISSPEYIIQTYIEWFDRLVVKNTENTGLNSYQDICLMGMVRRIMQDSTISNLPFLLSGIVLFGLQYLRIKQYKEKGFRLMMLASVLIFTVIFSTGSESPTYIIAFVGVAIWFVIQPKPISKFYIVLFVLAIILTSLSPSDLMPKFLRENYIRPFALKALPCVLIWIAIIYEMLTKKFNNYNTLSN